MKRHGQSLRLNILKAYLRIRRAYEPQTPQAIKASEAATYKEVADKYRN